MSRVLKTSYCDQNGIQDLTQPQFKGGNVYYEASFPDTHIANPYIVNSWYLTEIDDPLTNRQILFSYDYNNIISSSETEISYYKENDYSII